MVSIPQPVPRPERRLGAREADPWPADVAHGRHSRRVALLKRVLPGVGITLLLLTATWPRLAPLWEHLRFAFPAINLRDARELDMIHPRYAGVDRNGHPFVVIAASGRQLPDREDLMSLKAPRADIKTHSGANIVVTAETGIYQSRTQILDLFGNVTLVHQNGTKFVTQSARVEVASNRAEGNQPIEGHGPSGDVTAQGFRILDKGDTILFTGRSDLLLKRATPVAPAHPPAALPAPIAVAMRQAAVAAKPFLATAHPQPAAARRRHRPTGHRRTGLADRRTRRGPVRHRNPAAHDRG